MSISVNTVILDLANETQHLILWISPDGGHGFGLAFQMERTYL